MAYWKLPVDSQGINIQIHCISTQITTFQYASSTRLILCNRSLHVKTPRLAISVVIELVAEIYNITNR